MLAIVIAALGRLAVTGFGGLATLPHASAEADARAPVLARPDREQDDAVFDR